MADNKVKFLRGTAAEYEVSAKDNDVFYYITDTQKLYLGTNEVTGGSVTVDNELSDTSTNPVQNKVINTALAGKASSSHTHNYAGSSSAGGVANSAVKLNTKPYSITISTSDWTSNFSGGYMATKTITGVTTADNYIADVLLSSDQSAAKLQLEAWSYICDGNIVVTADNTVVFYAFTTKPTTNVTIEMQVIS